MRRELIYIVRLTVLVLIPLLAVTALVAFLTAQYIDSAVLVVVVLLVYTVIVTSAACGWIFWLIEHDVI